MIANRWFGGVATGFLSYAEKVSRDVTVYIHGPKATQRLHQTTYQDGPALDAATGTASLRGCRSHSLRVVCQLAQWPRPRASRVLPAAKRVRMAKPRFVASERKTVWRNRFIAPPANARARRLAFNLGQRSSI